MSVIVASAMSLISSLVCALLFGGGYAKSVVGHVGLILIITVGVSLKDASPFPKVTCTCLADQQGTRIDAIIPPIQYKKYFKRYLMEGEWYLMTNFQLIDPPKKIRNSGHLTKSNVSKKQLRTMLVQDRMQISSTFLYLQTSTMA
ncbi:hypothetical protein ISN44_As13g026270 [Arabidopsis suecica]|uniref:Replication protein A 70 kDa DNA-binding subunit B/D first OB fold domain-containing protein n=1 Tax=Arabidopsis suecica TaxID=45249 RepID=A0A8T1XXN8_ARASU|nr:hypothetical protein ISN44_As13g026270 [Arabidopsis suecica]